MAGRLGRGSWAWLLGLLVSALAFAFIVSPAAASTATITLSPQVGPPTKTVTVTGSGFAATETVIITFNGTQKATATTNALGSFTASFAVPSSAKPGLYKITATGQTSSASASAMFRVRTDWPMFHFDVAGTGYNPYENVVGTSNAKNLVRFGTGALSPQELEGSSPVLWGGMVYVKGYYNKLYAFSATCLNQATTCQPLWTASAAGGVSDLAVSQGVVYVSNSDTTGLAAYDAFGSNTYCFGSPRTCNPKWIGTTKYNGTAAASPVVANGTIYFPGGGQNRTLYAFSAAAGSANCSVSSTGTKTCNPLWSAAVASDISTRPTVANHVIYVSAGKLYAFTDAYSNPTYCNGSPIKTCTPLWTSTTAAKDGEPAVGSGTVYTNSGNGILSAFSTAAGSSCSGAPPAKTCAPLWSTQIGWSYETPAIAGSVLYTKGVNSFLNAISSTGTRLWTTAQGATGQNSTPAVAHGVVYIGDSTGHLRAYNTTRTTACTGTIPTCPALFVSSQIAAKTSPIIANGVVYSVAANQVAAFHF
ncbi:MAG: hypothetical protein QOH28_597 [Actinomycetota bacterium]|nr:hypothetical protein [Actinomycetota bacterium]